MAFPGILRRLFQNGGAGPLLRPEILPSQNMSKYDQCEFYFFRHPTLKPGFQSAHGGLIANAATAYHKAWAYLQTVEGQKLCITEAQWQAMVNAVWHTNADGSRVGWNGIGGAPFYVLNTGNGTLRLPDLRGMYAEAAGFDALGVGGVHGDGMRRITGTLVHDGAGGGGIIRGRTYKQSNGAFTYADGTFSSAGVVGGQGVAGGSYHAHIDSGRVVPPAAKNQPRAWGSLACVCLDPAAS